MQLQVGVKVLIKNKQGLYLFIERTDPLAPNEPSSWDIPGGRINPEESLDDALAREVREETGASLSGAPKLLAAQDIFVKAKNLHVVRLTYLLEGDIKNISLSEEHRSYKWVSLADAGSINIEPYLKAVVNKLK